jgi:hypothetical protein
MPPIIEGPPPEGERKPLIARLVWFVGLMLASLGTTAGVAYFLRWLIL